MAYLIRRINVYNQTNVASILHFKVTSNAVPPRVDCCGYSMEEHNLIIVHTSSTITISVAQWIIVEVFILASLRIRLPSTPTSYLHVQPRCV